MAWVVDTCIVLDVALGDSTHGRRSVEMLEKKLKAGLIICPVTFIELAPQFEGSIEELEQFLEMTGILFDQDWSQADTIKASEAFTSYIQLRRLKKSVKRPIADIMIGSFASRFDGLLTRNRKDFESYFPKLTIVEP